MLQNEIENHLKPVIEDLGYELWGCEYLAGRNQTLLRIYIDHVEGISLDDCERVSHQVSAVLDVEDWVPDNYRLEISSPGIPRPLFYPWQYQRYIGQEARIRVFKPINGQRNLMGIITAADEFQVQLTLDTQQMLELPFANIVKASLQD